ncbi:rhombosortase [Aliidiomarina sp.]|uniref:rhombosortase n=1 Tax=Aliidiomarina sp. TaxID=1872439 RepID=UPI003A4D70B0
MQKSDSTLQPSLSYRLRFLIAPFVIIAVMLTVFLLPGIEPWLVLTENGVLSQPWRIFTTHLVHLNSAHLAVNCIALLAIAVIFRNHVKGRLLINVMLISALAATLIPVLLAQDYAFVGLSGVLHGVVVYGGLLIMRTQRPVGVTILLIVIVKLVIDLMLADTQNEWLGAEVAYLCHVGGAIGGALAVPGLRRKPIEVIKTKH